MLDECDYDKRLGANEKTDFGYKATEVPLESSESSSEFEVHENLIQYKLYCITYTFFFLSNLFFSFSIL